MVSSDSCSSEGNIHEDLGEFEESPPHDSNRYKKLTLDIDEIEK
jgi:hypothetical protein